MLIQFSVSNFRSYNNQQTLSLVASNYEKELQSNIIKPSRKVGKGRAATNILKSVAIYGANASGKSNLIKALSFMRRQVAMTERSPNAVIDVQPFKLASSTITMHTPCELEIVFVEQGKTYQYGFSCDREKFREEWLLIDEEEVFHRVWNDEEKAFEYLMLNLDGVSEAIAEVWKVLAKNPNSLFIPKAVNNGGSLFQPVVDWFEKKLVITDDFGRGYSTEQLDTPEKKKAILDFLHQMGLQEIEEITSRPTDVSALRFPDDIPETIKAKILEDFQERKDVFFMRKSQEGENARLMEFDIDTDESDGTKALFAFAGPLLDILQKDKILVVDEIDSSLHPLAVHQLVDMVHCHKSQAQLVFTTHDTSVLSKKIMRRDQVWFTEKSNTLASELYSLAELSPRKDEAIESRYLNGRYGGVPILPSLDFHHGQ